MAYATQADIEAIYSLNALYVADRDGDGNVDSAAVDRALSSASDEIDSYLATRYPVPLAEVPGIVTQYAVDVALYRLALSAEVLTEELRRRYEDTIAALKRIAKGEQALVLPVDPGESGEELGTNSSDGPTPIIAGGPERLFSRDQTRDL